MIGWNYPEKGNLQDMIEDEGLHPVTCLVSLTDADKRFLLEQRIVLCSEIKTNPQLLKTILGQNFDVRPVVNEINEL